ncbi:unnamed protein product, partial [Prorocentrum cordatum]
ADWSQESPLRETETSIVEAGLIEPKAGTSTQSPRALCLDELLPLVPVDQSIPLSTGMTLGSTWSSGQEVLRWWHQKSALPQVTLVQETRFMRDHE